jgi:peptidyl-tRNA hydrolase
MEWFTPDATLDVRQGDLLISKDPRTGGVDKLTIVITADCDISKGKFGSHLAGLKVIFFDEYIKSIWSSRKLEKLVRDEKSNLHKKICKHHSELLGSPSALTDEGVITWLLRDSPEKIAEALKVPEGQLKKFLVYVANYSNAFRSLLLDYESTLSKYVSFFSALNARDSSSVLNSLVSQAQSETLPDDIFFLPCVADVAEKGAVVLLREVVAVPYTAIRYRLSEVSQQEQYLRSSRLKPEIKYALSQAFGNLYSKIGLSADYESRRKSAIAQVSSFQWS